MNETNADRCVPLWQRYVANQTEAESLKLGLLKNARPELLACLRGALHRPSERFYALRFLKVLPDEDRKALMPELLALATWQNQVTELATELIFSVSRDWLRNNIIEFAEPLLNGSDYQEYWGVLDICAQLDRQMALDLARQIATHSDPDIREAGEAFVEKLSQSPISETGMKDFSYFVCDGGPHLVLPHSARRDWKGMGEDALYSKTAHGRAGGVMLPIGLIPVGEEQALVLAGNPPMSAWGPLPPQEKGVDLYVLRAWKNIDLDALVRSAVARTLRDAMVDTGLRWKLGKGGATLMFAGDRPGHAGEVPIPIPAGTYKILDGEYEGEDGQVSIFRLVE